jgi:hypothetical protein
VGGPEGVVTVEMKENELSKTVFLFRPKPASNFLTCCPPVGARDVSV